MTPGAQGQPLGEAEAILAEVPGWSLIEHDRGSRLVREFSFPDFAAALAFTNRLGALAEAENHHPSILTEWGRVTVSWWTHTAGAAQARDVRLAAATTGLYQAGT